MAYHIDMIFCINGLFLLYFLKSIRMIELLIFIWFKEVISKMINPTSFSPDLSYSLTKYKPMKYSSIKQCINAETILYGNGSAPAIFSEILKRIGFQELMYDNILNSLEDKSIKLTNSEKAAIYLFTATKLFSDGFNNQVRTGKIGHFNCYMDLLISGMKKLKKPDNGAKIVPTFKKGQKLILDSYTSTSRDFNTALQNAKAKNITSSGITGAIIVINNIAENSRDIQALSSYYNEYESLYPPMTKFWTLSDPYIMYCAYDAFELTDCKYSQITYDMRKVVFINVSEIDEKPEYIEIENPYQTPPPTNSPYPTKTKAPTRTRYQTHSPEYPNPTKRPPPSKNDENECKSSSKSSCDDDESSSKILGDFRIEEAFIGASSIVDFDIGNTITHRARMSLGKIIPPPSFLHPAIWVGSINSTNESLGGVFVYGKYHPKKNFKIYLSKDGAKSYTLTLKEFKEKYNAFNLIKVVPQKNINLIDFMEEVKLSGKWNAKDYQWATNNCQHFVSKCLNILHAVRYLPNENDWMYLPSIILKILKLNEKSSFINNDRNLE